MNTLVCAMVLAMACFGTVASAAVAGTVTEISSFTIPKSPSGMFFFPAQDLLYILCGTQTNGDHYIYAYTTSGTQKCFITIPSSASMARVDGIWIDDSSSKAYIVDSQGPIHSQSLGGSVYEVAWTNPCGCDSTGTCTTATTNWSPSVTKTWTFAAGDINDGGGNDEYFRNSGIVVKGDHLYAVNGVHPNPNLQCCYPKSLVKYTMAGSGGSTSVAKSWAYTAATLGHDVDMEGLTCGADNCDNYIYVGDEYNYIYKVNLATTDPAAAVETQWNARCIIGTDIPNDKGIESLTYAATTGYFYAGIQQNQKVYVLQLADSDSNATDSCSSTATASLATSTASISLLLTSLVAFAQVAFFIMDVA